MYRLMIFIIFVFKYLAALLFVKTNILKTKENLFLINRTNYLNGELTDEAFSSKVGYSSMDYPNILKKITNKPTSSIVVITNLELVSQIGQYSNPNDPDIRQHMKGFNKILNTSKDCIIAQKDAEAIVARKHIKTVLHNDIGKFRDTLENDLLQWIKSNEGRIVNLVPELNTIIMMNIAVKILGFTSLLELSQKANFNLRDFFSTIDSLERSIMNMDIIDLYKCNKKLKEYSQLLYQTNHDFMDNNYIFNAILSEVDSTNNIAATLLITNNISRLIYFSVIRIAISDTLSEQFTKAIIEKNTEIIDCYYKECCRMFAGPPMHARFSSTPLTLTYQEDGRELTVTFPKNTLFEIPTRRLRFSNKYFDSPKCFLPMRHLKKENNNPLSRSFSPFGIGKRRCPAAGKFVRDYWETALTVLFSKSKIKIANGTWIENISSREPMLELKNEYRARLTGLQC